MRAGRTSLMIGVLTLLALSVPVDASAQQKEPPPGAGERFQLKLGATYDEGEFGTGQTTRTLFVPLTFKYLAERFDVGLTLPYVRLDSPGGVLLIEGRPQSSRQGPTRRVVEDGVGDLVLKGRYFLVDDRGPNSLVPGLAPFGKVKFPTADEDRGLGTGEFDYGFGLEFDKQIPANFFLFGDGSYTVIGSPSGQDLRNRPGASFGVGYKLTKALSVSSFIDWRRAVVRGKDDPTEIWGTLTYKLSPTISVSPHVFGGLTDGSPDFGGGIELAWKFGR